VRAGLNGVMMGNFLTTLGNTPDEDRAMFEQLGLNVARQADNGSNPRPDNRSGWLEGETPDVVSATLEQDPPASLDVRLWDPTTQLRFSAKQAVPRRPDGAPNSGQGRETREAAARRAGAA
jgi:biotin synthase